MKTIFIWDECEGQIRFFVLKGDHSRFSNLYINSGGAKQDLQDELCSLIYDEHGSYHPEIKFLGEFPLESLTCLSGLDAHRCFDHKVRVITCGFIP